MSRSAGHESAYSSCPLALSEGGHGLTDGERDNGVMIAGRVYLIHVKVGDRLSRQVSTD